MTKRKKEIDFNFYSPERFGELMTNNPEVYYIRFKDVTEVNGDYRLEIVTKVEESDWKIFKTYAYSYMPTELCESNIIVERKTRNT